MRCPVTLPVFIKGFASSTRNVCPEMHSIYIATLVLANAVTSLHLKFVSFKDIISITSCSLES